MNLDGYVSGVPYVPMIYYHPYQFSPAAYTEYAYPYQTAYGAPTPGCIYDTATFMENASRPDVLLKNTYLTAG